MTIDEWTDMQILAACIVTVVICHPGQVEAFGELHQQDFVRYKHYIIHNKRLEHSYSASRIT